MNRTVLLHFYPRTWRARYEEEFSAVLEQLPLTLPFVFDTLCGALDAHLHPVIRTTRNHGEKKHGRNKIGRQFLVLVVAVALQRPYLASGCSLPRRRHNLIFFA